MLYDMPVSIKSKSVSVRFISETSLGGLIPLKSPLAESSALGCAGQNHFFATVERFPDSHLIMLGKILYKSGYSLSIGFVYHFGRAHIKRVEGIAKH